MANNKKKWLNIFFKISSYLPITWLLLLYLFAILAWVKLGNFPIPSQDDPKYLGVISTILFMPIWFGMLSIPYNLLVWIILLIPSLICKTQVKREIFFFVIGMFLIYIQFHFDLFSLIEWIYD